MWTRTIAAMSECKLRAKVEYMGFTPETDLSEANEVPVLGGLIDGWVEIDRLLVSNIRYCCGNGLQVHQILEWACYSFSVEIG